MDTIWQFDTARFSVRLNCEYDQDPDLSWRDEEQEEYDREHGVEYYVFCVEVLCDGVVIGRDYLGGSGYSDPRDFAKERGGYFSDMVSEAIREARKWLASRPHVRNAA